MQKWKIVLWTLLVLGFTSSEVFAADTKPSDSTAAKNNTQSDALPAPVQDHMIEMMQDDFTFENQKRALSNELELEKIRSEIQKAKGITEVAPVVETSANNTDANEGTPDEGKMIEEMPLPKVLLVSDIGGVSRVAISSNNVVKLVKINEKFSMDGHNFIVFNAGHNMPTIKEVTP